MAWIEVEVDIIEHLDEVQPEFLIQELASRKLSKSQKVKLYEVFKNEIEHDINFLRIDSILDRIKVETFIQNFDKKSVSEIEIFFNTK